MGRAELLRDPIRRRWYLTWSVKVVPPRQIEGGSSAAIDLGVRIGGSLSIAGIEQALHFDNKALLAEWDYLGREIAREQEAIAGTRGKVREDRAPSSRGIRRLHQKRRLRLEHAIRCFAKAIAEHCFAHGVSMV